MSSCVSHDLPTLVRMRDREREIEERGRENNGGAGDCFVFCPRQGLSLISFVICSHSLPLAHGFFDSSHIKHILISTKTQEVEPQQAADAVRSASLVFFLVLVPSSFDVAVDVSKLDPLFFFLFLILFSFPLLTPNQAPSTPSSSAASWEPSGPSTSSLGPSRGRRRTNPNLTFSSTPPAGTAPSQRRSTSAPRPLAPGP